MTEQRIFKCVPLEDRWHIAGTKMDMKAMYRRPRRSTGEYDEVVHERAPDGRPLFDLVGPLPLRRHSDWIAKGFEYVTVFEQPGREGSFWPYVAESLRKKGLNPADYLQHPQLGTWNPKLYLATEGHVDAARFSELRALVEKLGSDAVLDVRRSTEPTFTLPPDLMGILPGGLKQTGAVEATRGNEDTEPSAPAAAAKPKKTPTAAKAPKAKSAAAAVPSEVQG